MPRIIVDEHLHNRLMGLISPVELCDASGRILGRFVPAATDYGPVELQVSNEELEQRAREGGGRPLRDILADLERPG